MPISVTNVTGLFGYRFKLNFSDDIGYVPGSVASSSTNLLGTANTFEGEDSAPVANGTPTSVTVAGSFSGGVTDSGVLVQLTFQANGPNGTNVPISFEFAELDDSPAGVTTQDSAVDISKSVDVDVTFLNVQSRAAR